MNEPRILYAGQLGLSDSRSLCRVRYEALQRIGALVLPFDFVPFYAAIGRSISRRIAARAAPAVLMRELNKALIEKCREVSPDVVYVDKGVHVELNTLRQIRSDAASRRGGAMLIHFHPDDAFHPKIMTRSFERSLLEYDLHLSPHRWVLEEYARRGCKDAQYLPYGYEPLQHYRTHAHSPFGPEVVFVGRWEKMRGAMINSLADSGVPVDVWGPGWSGRKSTHRNVRWRGDFATFEEQREVFGTARISLGALSSTNYDGHTSRTFEIPACGGFMLSERTDGLSEFFQEESEVAGYRGAEEFLKKVHYYLHPNNTEEREAIREAGHIRCTQSGYDYDSRMQLVIDMIEDRRNG